MFPRTAGESKTGYPLVEVPVWPMPVQAIAGSADSKKQTQTEYAGILTKSQQNSVGQNMGYVAGDILYSSPVTYERWESLQTIVVCLNKQQTIQRQCNTRNCGVDSTLN